ncbi:MAG: metallopeptidase family protein [Myxococcota bacterium]
MPSDPIDAANRAVLDHLVHEALDLLDADRLDAAAANVAEATALAPHDPAVLAARGQLAWARGEPHEARDLFRRAVDRDPSQTDAHYALARLAEDAGDHATQVRHDLKVLALDTAAHRRGGVGNRAQVALIEQIAEHVLQTLPEPFASRLAAVPVVLEPRPSVGLVQDGFDPRAFGLFEGPEDFGQRSHAVTDRPSRIVVFFANLLEAFADEAELRTQVEVTLLHEIGHFFGLDEDRVAALGLG